MPIDYRRLRSLTARQLVRALTQAGFALRRQTGSHQHYTHRDGRRVTVSFHRPSDTFPVKALRSMIERQALWTEEDVARLALAR